MEARRWLQETQSVPNVNLLLNSTVVDLQLNGNAVSRAVVLQDGQRIGVEAHEFVLAGGGIENARLLLTSNRQIPQGIGNEHDLVGRFFMEHPHVTSGFMTLRTPESAGRMSFFDPHMHKNFGREGVLVPTAETCERLSIPNAAIWFHSQSTRCLAKRLVRRQTNSLGSYSWTPKEYYCRHEAICGRWRTFLINGFYASRTRIGSFLCSLKLNKHH